MKNELLTIGPFTLYGYGFMIGLGVLAGCALAWVRAKKRNRDPDFLFSLALTALLSGFAGAKVLFWLCNLGEMVRNPGFLLDTLGDGFVVYGGILGGILGVVLYCGKKRSSWLYWTDLLVPSLALGQGFGRLGCLLAGCCYGAETSHRPWLIFTDSWFAPSGVRLIPTQIYSSLLDFAHAALLLLLAPRLEAKEGRLAGVYLLLYSAGRFLVEFWRGDAARGFVGPLSTSQFLAIFTGLGALLLLTGPFSKDKVRYV